MNLGKQILGNSLLLPAHEKVRQEQHFLFRRRFLRSKNAPKQSKPATGKNSAGRKAREQGETKTLQIGCRAGIRTPIPRSRVSCPTVRRPGIT